MCTRANLVDLAGSEDQRDTRSSGSTLREAADINKSLFTLRKAIACPPPMPGAREHARAHSPQAIEHLANTKHNRAAFQEETLTTLLAAALLGQAPNARTRARARTKTHSTEARSAA